MAENLTGSAQVNVTIKHSNTNALATEKADFQYTSARNFTFGTGAAVDEINEIYQGLRTLAASASENLDLNGALVRSFGHTAVFTKIKAIYIELPSGIANQASSIQVGGAASNQFVGPFGTSTHTIRVDKGGKLYIETDALAAWAVVAATGDLLKILNNDGVNVAQYRIILIGDQ